MRNITRCTDGHAGLEINRQTMNGKPVYEIVVKEIMNFKSGFAEKGLCDGITFSMGSACVFSCTFCYVEGMVRKHPAVVALRKELDAAGLRFQDVVIVRLDALDILREQLTLRRPRRVSPEEPRVVYTSPLVDCAANIGLALQTVEACKTILTLTNWHVRLLSKGNLLPNVARALESHRDRLIFGVSTGTLDDALAASFERGTALVSKRLESLHWLQDHGFRTFGMLCPSLPQVDYDSHAARVAEAIRVERCEHVWAEVMNMRGPSLTNTVDALSTAGYHDEAHRLVSVCGSGNRTAWEAYARATFGAHARHIPAHKLRFLQYINPKNREWWLTRQHQGVVPLGAAVSQTI